VNGLQAGIVILKWMVLARGGHPFDDIPGSPRKSQKASASGLR